MRKFTSARAFVILMLAFSLCVVPVPGNWAVGSTSLSHPVRRVSMASSVAPSAAGNPAARGPFVTILFSRTEMTAADNCAPENRGIAPLDTTVASYLRSLGMSATGTLETGNMKPTAPLCVHYQESLGASWADAAKLARNYGWSFGSATATYPVKQLNDLPPAKVYAETCGSAHSIDAHGLPGGHGIIAYPGRAQVPTAIQARYGAKCFAWGRRYGDQGITPASAGSTPPYWQHTTSLNGGSCHVRDRPCFHVTPGTPTGRLPRYVLPSKIISRIKALRAGQWLTFQAYLLVTGTNPTYRRNTTRWNCTSSNPELHWTNDNERYCYNDWKRIVNAVAALRNITVTGPLTVGAAFGRPTHFSFAAETGLHPLAGHG